MEIKSILVTKLSEIKDEIKKKEKKYYRDDTYYNEVMNKIPLPWYTVFILAIFLGTIFGKFNYFSIPTGLYLLYIAYKTFVWSENLKEIKRFNTYTKRSIRDLKIEYNTYQKMKETLCGEEAKYFDV